MSVPRDTAFGICLATVSAVGFSVSLVLARFSYDFGTNALTVLLIRFLLMVALAYAWCRLQRQPLLGNGRALALCYLMGLFYFIGIGSYLSSVAYVPVSLAVLFFYTFPIITALLAAAQARKPPRAEEILALLLAFAGIFLALDFASVEMHPVGIGLALLAALGVAVNLLIAEHVVRVMPIGVFTVHMSISAIACAAAVTLATDSFSLPRSGTPGQLAFAIMLLAFITAFLSGYLSVRLIGSVRVAVILNLEPVATMFFALVLLGEIMSPRQYSGAALVIGAVVAAQAIRWHRQQAELARRRRT